MNHASLFYTFVSFSFSFFIYIIIAYFLWHLSNRYREKKWNSPLRTCLECILCRIYLYNWTQAILYVVRNCASIVRKSESYHYYLCDFILNFRWNSNLNFGFSNFTTGLSKKIHGFSNFIVGHSNFSFGFPISKSGISNFYLGV